jgi:hypothetical protein
MVERRDLSKLKGKGCTDDDKEKKTGSTRYVYEYPAEIQKGWP